MYMAVADGRNKFPIVDKFPDDDDSRGPTSGQLLHLPVS